VLSRRHRQGQHQQDHHSGKDCAYKGSASKDNTRKAIRLMEGASYPPAETAYPTAPSI
jgi:hypothetical protein